MFISSSFIEVKVYVGSAKKQSTGYRVLDRAPVVESHLDHLDQQKHKKS